MDPQKTTPPVILTSNSAGSSSVFLRVREAALG